VLSMISGSDSDSSGEVAWSREVILNIDMATHRALIEQLGITKPVIEPWEDPRAPAHPVAGTKRPADDDGEE